MGWEVEPNECSRCPNEHTGASSFDLCGEWSIERQDNVCANRMSSGNDMLIFGIDPGKQTWLDVESGYRRNAGRTGSKLVAMTLQAFRLEFGGKVGFCFRQDRK